MSAGRRCESGALAPTGDTGRASDDDIAAETVDAGVDVLARLLQPPVDDLSAARPCSVTEPATPSVATGRLVALVEGRQAPLVLLDEAGGRAVVARTTVDLKPCDVGQTVLLAFDRGNPRLPIVIGIVRADGQWPFDQKPGQVQIDAQGQRIVVSAAEQLVLRCGEASITLTKAGKVLIEGSYILSRSSGVNRIRGGSVQLN